MLLEGIKKRLRTRKEEEHRAFREKFMQYRELLDRNNEVLRTISTLSEVREDRIWFSLSRLRGEIAHAAANVYRMIESLDAVTEGRYPALRETFAELETKIVAALDTHPAPQIKELTLPVGELDRRLAGEVGLKAATLGEIRRTAKVRVPDGVALTVFAYQRFLEHNRLQEHINKEHLALDPEDLSGVERVSRRVQRLVLEADLPPELEEALHGACERLRQRGGAGFVLRSSAVGEDEQCISFAGLYRTVINPPPGELGRAYKEVVASKFSTRAMLYRIRKGIYEEYTPMGALLMALIPAQAAGVLFSQDPTTSRDDLLISAVWGLGKLAVDGTLTPDRYRVSRTPSLTLADREAGLKTHMLIAEAAVAGTQRRLVAPERRDLLCLGDDRVLELALLGCRIEKALGAPQDVEWVLDPAGDFHIVQCRPLMMPAPEARWEDLYPPLDDAAPLTVASGLLVASTGAACGQVVAVDRPSDLQRLEPGAVLLADNTRPDLAPALHRASALLAENGNPSGHLSILAREFHVPLLIGIPRALRPRLLGMEAVTVDGFKGALYEGRIKPLLELAARVQVQSGSPVRTPLQVLMDDVLQHVTPLHLINPRDASFRPQGIRTIHDMIRFIHETAINAMFEVNDARISKLRHVKKLVTDVPLNIHLIDMGGGLAEDADESRVTPDQIISIPFQAVYRGMTTPGVRWAGHIPIDLKSFVSVFANTLYDGAKHERRLGDRSYAIVGRSYLNFSSRLGYHFSIIDAHVGPSPSDNYISFRFKGGAAGLEKRTRRALFIARVLETHGFWVDQKGDLVNARIKRLEAAAMEQRLVMLGRLMGCSRQLDVTMNSETRVEDYVARFLAGDYSMGLDDKA